LVILNSNGYFDKIGIFTDQHATDPYYQNGRHIAVELILNPLFDIPQHGNGR
jgi:hypothetical protein